MDKNYDDMVTVDEFIKVFVEAETVLEKKLKKANQNIIEFRDHELKRVLEDR